MESDSVFAHAQPQSPFDEAPPVRHILPESDPLPHAEFLWQILEN